MASERETTFTPPPEVVTLALTMPEVRALIGVARLMAPLPPFALPGDPLPEALRKLERALAK